MDLPDHDLVDHRINRLGASLLFAEPTLARGAAAGITDAAVLYAGGRAGAMGDVRAPVVQAAFCFFSTSAVDEVWALVEAAGRPSELAAVYAEGLADAARATWDPDAAATLHRIGEQLAGGIELVGLPLFGSWRAMPRPADPIGAAALTAMTLRELRGDVHVQSVAAVGLTPLEAELGTRGEAWATLHGWHPPFPDVAAALPRLAEADEITSRRMGALHAALSRTQHADLAEAVAVLAPAE
jgi:hypothetical protein